MGSNGGRGVTYGTGRHRPGAGACHGRGSPQASRGAPDRRRRAWCFLTYSITGWLIGIPAGYLLDLFLVWMVKKVININLTLAFPPWNLALPREAVMMLHDIPHDIPADSGPDAPATSEQLARQEAIKQIERRRRFWVRAAIGTLGLIVLVIIWAMTEYHNAGGWPTQGFSDSSSIPNVWNYWIIYPAIFWALFLASDALLVFRNRPISETEIKREIDRQAGHRGPEQAKE